MIRTYDVADLRALYQRRADSPLITGDHVDQARVAGFALTRHPEPADQMLIDGDEELAEPPLRPIPGPADPGASICRDGPSPIQRLDPGSLHEAAQYLGETFEQLLIGRGRDGEFIRTLLAEIAGRRHLAWLVGGSIRDLIAEGPSARVNDLDFTGTIGPAELWSIAAGELRGSGLADYRQRISPQLVWSVTPPNAPTARDVPPHPPKDRVIEYKPLAQTGFRFPAWGGDLAGDAATRDLTVNSIYYDNERKVVADPTGRGLTDLRATPRAAVTAYQGDDRAEQACIVLRCLKFRIRWPDLDLSEMNRWAGLLPDDLAGRIPAHRWAMIVRLRDRCIPEPNRGADELAIAAELGSAAVRLIETIHQKSAA